MIKYWAYYVSYTDVNNHLITPNTCIHVSINIMITSNTINHMITANIINHSLTHSQSTMEVHAQ